MNQQIPLIVDSLNDAIRDTVRAMGDTQIKGRLYVAGMRPVLSKPEELTAQMDAELKRWAQVVKNRKIKAS